MPKLKDKILKFYGRIPTMLVGAVAITSVVAMSETTYQMIGWTAVILSLPALAVFLRTEVMNG